MTASRVPSPDLLVRVPPRNQAQCTVCRHKKRMEIENALVHGTLRGVARQFGISRMAAARHKKHVVQGMERLAQIHGFTLRGSLEDQMRAIGHAFARLAGLCESIGQYSVAIAAGREARETVRELHSWLAVPEKGTQVNVAIGVKYGKGSDEDIPQLTDAQRLLLQVPDLPLAKGQVNDPDPAGEAELQEIQRARELREIAK